jgi:hypothetical protein
MKSQARRFLSLGFLASALSVVLFGHPVAGQAAQVLAPTVTTNKGCRETGQNPVFSIGERINVSFRIGSASTAHASASIFDHTTDGRLVILSFGTVSTNQTFTFAARVAGPAGDEQLILRAVAGSASANSSPCTFTVGGAPPATITPHVTRTPTPTRTPRSTHTPITADLTGDLHTSRGCREDGDSATFAVGEAITLIFRLDSDTSSAALASIAGAQTILSFGAVPTNVPLLVSGRVGPPAGLHTLRLRGSLGGPQTVLDTCSFLVTGDVFPTPTFKPTRTRTPTRTFTPVPGACVGACTNPGMVSVNDLLTVIQIAAGQITLSACPSADPNGDDQVSLDEVLQAVNNALDGCP